MTPIPMRTFGRFVRGTTRGTYITEHTECAGTGRGTLLGRGPASVVRPSPTRLTQQNAIRRIGGRIEPPAPSQVVPPSCGRDAAATPEGDPPRFLMRRHPGSFDAVVLPERHDVAHADRVGEGRK